MDIKGSKILVTGGASGMGRHVTPSLARDGAAVAFCAVNADGEGPESALELGGARVLCQVPRRSGPQRPQNVVFSRVHGKDQNAGVGEFSHHAGRRLDAVEPGHPYVQDHHLRMVLSGEVEGLAAVCCLGHHLHSGKALEE
jgi:NAD(P)-dependent dehydrogenase (short-subunit alcohol dehydrogenase family)